MYSRGYPFKLRPLMQLDGLLAARTMTFTPNNHHSAISLR